MFTISRQGIDSWEITQLEPSERFIKLPIDKYLELLPVNVGGNKSNMLAEINRPQIALVNAINSPKYRFVCAAFSRRLGKTEIANIVAQLVVLIPGCNVLIMSPNYALSTISFEKQRKLMKLFDLEITKDNTKDRVIELSNGSTVRMGSVSQVDSCVGRSYNLILFDEAALSKDGEEAFNVSLRPTLDLPNSKAIFISTPRGKRNWFSRFHGRGSSPEFPEWVSLTADYEENPRMSVKDVEEAKRSMSKAEFEQEYMASFTTYEGQIFPISSEHIIEELPPGKYEYFGGLDPGYKDPTAFVVIAYEYETEIYYVVADYKNNESTTAQHAEQIQKLIDEFSIETIFIDSAAAQFASDLAYIYDIATTKAKKAVLEGISFIQTLVQQERLKVLSSCGHVLDAMDQYQWDPNENLVREKPIHNDASHISDALRYALYTFTV